MPAPSILIPALFLRFPSGLSVPMGALQSQNPTESLCTKITGYPFFVASMCFTHGRHLVNIFSELVYSLFPEFIRHISISEPLLKPCLLPRMHSLLLSIYANPDCPSRPKSSPLRSYRTLISWQLKYCCFKNCV